MIYYYSNYTSVSQKSILHWEKPDQKLVSECQNELLFDLLRLLLLNYADQIAYIAWKKDYSKNMEGRRHSTF